MRALTIVAAALTMQGCGLLDTDLVCTAQYVYAVTVEVQDALTRGPPNSTPTGTLTDGSYRETMESYGGQFLQGGGERPGTYDVEVRAEGYRPWRVEGVEAGHDGCHVESIHLVAEMVAPTAP